MRAARRLAPRGPNGALPDRPQDLGFLGQGGPSGGLPVLIPELPVRVIVSHFPSGRGSLVTNTPAVSGGAGAVGPSSQGCANKHSPQSQRMLHSERLVGLGTSRGGRPLCALQLGPAPVRGATGDGVSKDCWGRLSLSLWKERLHLGEGKWAKCTERFVLGVGWPSWNRAGRRCHVLGRQELPLSPRGGRSPPLAGASWESGGRQGARSLRTKRAWARIRRPSP